MRAFVIPSAVLLLLAGCAAPAETTDAGHEPPLPFDAEPLTVVSTATPEADPAPLTRNDWLVFPVTASMPGQAVGFRFPVPTGALVPAWYDADQRHAILELALIGNGSVEALHVVVGQAGQVLAEVSSFAQAQGWGASVNENTFSGGLGGTYVSFTGAEGDEMFMAIGAIGSGDATVGARFLPSDPTAALVNGQPYEGPSEDGPEFLARVEGRRAVYIAPWSEPTGMHIGMLYDYHGLGVGLPYGHRFAYGDIEVQAPIPEAELQPIVLLDARAEAPAGPGYASTTLWIWNELHVGLVDAVLRAPDGQEAVLMAPLVPDPLVQSTVALVRGEGEGDSLLDVSFQAAGAPTLFPQLIVLAHIRLDAPLQMLVGEAVDGSIMTYDGLPVEPPAVWFSGPSSINGRTGS